MTITTTLNRIRAHYPCQSGWTTLLKGLNKTAPDDEPPPFSRIVEINGLSDAHGAAYAADDDATRSAKRTKFLEMVQ